MKCKEESKQENVKETKMMKSKVDVMNFEECEADQ